MKIVETKYFGTNSNRNNNQKEPGWTEIMKPKAKILREDYESFIKRFYDLVESRRLTIDEYDYEKDPEYLAMNSHCQFLANNYEREYDGFTSQFHQDLILWKNFFRSVTKERKGFYVDVGSNDAKHISNTYFFDVCLGWEGVCIEVNTNYTIGYQNRSCKLIQKCVSDKKEEVFFNFDGYMGEVGKGSTKVKCDTLNNILLEAGVTNIDFMSMDIEGSEEKALRDFDLRKYNTAVILVESNQLSPRVTKDLVNKGYWLVQSLKIDSVFMRGLINV